MKNKYFFIFLFFGLLNLSAIGQNYKIELPPTYNKIYTSDELPGKDGSPYLIEQWLPGIINLNNGSVIKGLVYRYNVYKDEIQYKSGEHIYIIGTPDSLKELSIENKKIIYASFSTHKTSMKSFFEVAVDGKVQLLIHYTIGNINANFNPALNVGSKNDQLELRKTYFFQMNHQIIKIDRKGKKLYAQLPEKAVELSAFVKANKLSFSRESDLCQIINHCNSSN